MNKYWEFLVSSAVEKQVGARECLFSYSRDYEVDHLSELIEKSKHANPYHTKKGGASVFLLDDVVVKRDNRPYMRRLVRPRIITDSIFGARGLLAEGISTLVANQLGYPSPVLLGIRYLPLEKRTILISERISGHTFREYMLEKESQERCIGEMLTIMHRGLSKGVFHGDPATRNILFDTNAGDWKLIDFYQSVKLNTDIGMGLALLMGGIVSLPFQKNISTKTYIEMVSEYLGTHFGNQPQHGAVFLDLMNIRISNGRRLGAHKRIMYNMATLGKPDILAALRDTHRPLYGLPSANTRTFG